MASKISTYSPKLRCCHFQDSNMLFKKNEVFLKSILDKISMVSWMRNADLFRQLTAVYCEGSVSECVCTLPNSDDSCDFYSCALKHTHVRKIRKSPSEMTHYSGCLDNLEQKHWLRSALWRPVSLMARTRFIYLGVEAKKSLWVCGNTLDNRWAPFT